MNKLPLLLYLVAILFTVTSVSGCGGLTTTPFGKYASKSQMCRSCKPVTIQQTNKIVRGMLAKDAIKILGNV